MDVEHSLCPQGTFGSNLNCSKLSCEVGVVSTATSPTPNEPSAHGSCSSSSPDNQTNSGTGNPRIGSNPIPASLPACYMRMTQERRNSSTYPQSRSPARSTSDSSSFMGQRRTSGTCIASSPLSGTSSQGLAISVAHGQSAFHSLSSNSIDYTLAPIAEDSSMGAETEGQPIPEKLPACYSRPDNHHQSPVSIPARTAAASPPPEAVRDCLRRTSSSFESHGSLAPPQQRCSAVEYLTQASEILDQASVEAFPPNTRGASCALADKTGGQPPWQASAGNPGGGGYGAQADKSCADAPVQSLPARRVPDKDNNQAGSQKHTHGVLWLLEQVCLQAALSLVHPSTCPGV
jgi:hypothetical protein